MVDSSLISFNSKKKEIKRKGSIRKINSLKDKDNLRRDNQTNLTSTYKSTNLNEKNISKTSRNFKVRLKNIYLIG